MSHSAVMLRVQAKCAVPPYDFNCPFEPGKDCAAIEKAKLALDFFYRSVLCRTLLLD